MVKNVTYQQPIHHEENTPLVTIIEVKMDTKQATAIDSRKSRYLVDLTKASFGGISYPEVNTQWYLKKISGVWALMARAPQQNPQLNPALDPQPGESYLGDGGTTVVVGDLKANGNVVSDGFLNADAFNAIGTTGTDEAHTARVAGDAQKRYIVRDNGTTEWGSGSATPDTNLYRSAANTLKTDDSFIAIGDVTGARGFFGGAGPGIAVQIGDDAQLADVNTVDTLNVRGVQNAANGRISFGSGNDTRIYRSGSNQLTTDGILNGTNLPLRFAANFGGTEFGCTGMGTTGRWLFEVAWQLHVSGGTFFEGARLRVNFSAGTIYDWIVGMNDGGGDGVPSVEEAFANTFIRIGYAGGASLPGAAGTGKLTIQKIGSTLWGVAGTWMCNSGGTLHGGYMSCRISGVSDITDITISGVSGSTTDGGGITVVTPY